MNIGDDQIIARKYTFTEILCIMLDRYNKDNGSCHSDDLYDNQNYNIDNETFDIKQIFSYVLGIILSDKVSTEYYPKWETWRLWGKPSITRITPFLNWQTENLKKPDAKSHRDYFWFTDLFQKKSKQITGLSIDIKLTSTQYDGNLATYASEILQKLNNCGISVDMDLYNLGYNLEGITRQIRDVVIAAKKDLVSNRRECLEMDTKRELSRRQNHSVYVTDDHKRYQDLFDVRYHDKDYSAPLLNRKQRVAANAEKIGKEISEYDRYSKYKDFGSHIDHILEYEMLVRLGYLPNFITNLIEISSSLHLSLPKGRNNLGEKIRIYNTVLGEDYFEQRLSDIVKELEYQLDGFEDGDLKKEADSFLKELKHLCTQVYGDSAITNTKQSKKKKRLAVVGVGDELYNYNECSIR